MYYYTSKEFDNYIKIFSNNVDFKMNLLRESISLTDKKIRSLVEFLLSHKDELDYLSIEEVLIQNPESIREKSAEALGKKLIKDITLRSIMFTFKYASVKSFFWLNWRQFVPEYDYDMIMADDKRKVFFNAMMKELDRLDDAITSMYQAFDIDQIPYKYLEYLAGLIGYESEDKDLVKDYVFRDLIKNMIEVYKVKGSNYSFELFLTFLGFDVTIDEYWFDRRFFWKQKGANNEFTNEKYKYFSGFYLSPSSPEEYIPSSLSKKETVFKNDIKGTMDLNQFNRYFYEGGFTDRFGNRIELDGSKDEDIGYILGYTKKDGKYFEDPYTYFKTNVVKFNFSSFKEDKDQGELTSDDIKIINRIFEFLLPVFVDRQIVVMINEWGEDINPEKYSDSILNFNDLSTRNYFLNTDYLEVDNFDPIYEETKRWDPNVAYEKDAIVIYDESVEFELYMTVEKDDVVEYKNKFYKCLVNEKVCDTIPPDDPDFEEVDGYPRYYRANLSSVEYNKYDYVNMLSENVSHAVEFVSGMTLYHGIIIVYRDRYYKYDGEDKTAGEDFYNEPSMLALDNFYMSKINFNTFVLENSEGWWNFVPNDFILGMTVNPNDVLWYNGQYYFYRKTTSKNANYYPNHDTSFIRLNEKYYIKGTPEENPMAWGELKGDEETHESGYELNKTWFSVFDRIKKDEGKTDEEALDKISRMLTAVSVTSNIVTDFKSMDGKYLIFKFPMITRLETTKRYEQAKEINLNVPTVVYEEEVVKIRDNYYYCSNTGEDGYIILDSTNYTNYLTLIINNYAGDQFVSLYDNSVTVTFDSSVVDFTTFCDKIEEKFNEDINGMKISDWYDFTRKGNYFMISSKLYVDWPEEPWISIIYDFVKDSDSVSGIDYVIDPNNLYNNVFPRYYTSPRYRDDFSTETISIVAYEAKIRANYITENYPSARFEGGKIVKTDTVNSFFDSYSLQDINYSFPEDCFSEPIYPLLSYGFVFDDKNPKCYKDYYPSFTEYDIKAFNPEESTIYIELMNVSEVPMPEGQVIDTVLDYRNGSYEDKYEVEESSTETIDLVDRNDLISLLGHSGLPGDPNEIVT